MRSRLSCQICPETYLFKGSRKFSGRGYKEYLRLGLCDTLVRPDCLTSLHCMKYFPCCCGKVNMQCNKGRVCYGSQFKSNNVHHGVRSFEADWHSAVRVQRDECCLVLGLQFPFTQSGPPRHGMVFGFYLIYSCLSSG